MSVGDNIKNLRKLKKLNIRQLAELSAVGKSTISDIENNNVSPTTDTLSKLADALNVNVEDFFKNDSDNNDIEVNIPNEYLEKYTVTSRDKKQYIEHMKKATEAFFMNDEFDEEDKKEILDTMSELFWRAKEKNKRKPKSE